MNNWQDILSYNMKHQPLPRMINKFTVSKEKKFLIDYADIINPARSYFEKDPKVWKLPAKNYFVRICLAYYIAQLYEEDVYELMNNNDMLPYDDYYSKPYDRAKTIYDGIIKNIDIYNSYGYKKTIEVFGNLYRNEKTKLQT